MALSWAQQRFCCAHSCAFWFLRDYLQCFFLFLTTQIHSNCFPNGKISFLKFSIFNMNDTFPGIGLSFYDAFTTCVSQIDRSHLDKLHSSIYISPLDQVCPFVNHVNASMNHRTTGLFQGPCFKRFTY